MGLVLPITGGIRETRPVFRATGPRPPVELRLYRLMLKLIQSIVRVGVYGGF